MAISFVILVIFVIPVSAILVVNCISDEGQSFVVLELFIDIYIDRTDALNQYRGGSGENFKTHMVGRLDRILVDKSREFREVQFLKYLTVLAGTSDHIPLYIKLKSTVNSTQQPTC